MTADKQIFYYNHNSFPDSKAFQTSRMLTQYNNQIQSLISVWNSYLYIKLRKEARNMIFKIITAINKDYSHYTKTNCSKTYALFSKTS